MSKVPSFRFFGGKSRIRKWLVQYFPSVVNGWYVEPFTGKGNVFYEVASKNPINHANVHLNDLDARFLFAMRDFDPTALPEEVNKESFKEWRMKAEEGDQVAIVLEPRITFGGKGYKAGFSGTSGSHVGYSRQNYMSNCVRAKTLLHGVKITERSWGNINLDLLGSNDFVYLDPPYFGTTNPYGNINHVDLVEMLNRAKFKWALSGYDNLEYGKLTKVVEKHHLTRNSEIKSSNSHNYSPVVETLWLNYSTGNDLFA